MSNTVLVTGANRGLGLEFVCQYLAAGWRVLACSRSPVELPAGQAAAEPRLRRFTLDVADHDAIDALAAELAGTPIDVLLNNAGVYGRVGFAEGGIEAQRFGRVDYEDWAGILRINVMGPMKMAEAFVDHVAASRQKKIVSLTSIVGSMAMNTTGGLYAYRASKAALNAVMHSMGIDLRPRGIIAVAVHPGWARTAMGGPGADIDAPASVAGVRQVIDALAADDTGQVLAYDGSVLPY